MNSSRRLGFSLIELIVVIGVISLLMAMLIPAIQRVRESANQLSCKNKLKQLALAVHQYEKDYGVLPPRNLARTPPPSSISFAGVGWLAQLLPYIDEGSVWQGIPTALLQSWEGFKNPPHHANKAIIAAFACPSDSRMPGAWEDAAGYNCSYTSYIGVMGDATVTMSGTQNRRPYAEGPFGSNGSRFSSIRDGLSNTLLIGERPPPTCGMAGWWYSEAKPGKPICRMFDDRLAVKSGFVFCSYKCHDKESSNSYGSGDVENPCDAYHFWSFHPGGSLFAKADGSVHFLKYSIGDKLLGALATSHGGEAVILDE